MKLYYTILITLAFYYPALHSQESFSFEGQHVVIEGWAQHLTIDGTENPNISYRSSEEETMSKLNYSIDGESVTIFLSPTSKDLRITLPSAINLNIKMEDVVREGSFERIRPGDWRRVEITNVKGEIEFEADGYDLVLKNNTGSIAAVTYGNIVANYQDISTCELISLDTYWGDVNVDLPTNSSANLTIRARSGEIFLDPKFTFENVKKRKRRFSGTMQEGNTTIILHSEGGKIVSLRPANP